MKTTQFTDLNGLAEKATTVASLDAYIFKTAKRLSKFDDEPYNGGLWLSEKIGEGWFYCLSLERTWRIVNPGNCSDVKVGTKAFSLAVFLIALSEFSMDLYDNDIEEALSDEIIELHGNALSLAHTVLDEKDFSAFCTVID